MKEKITVHRSKSSKSGKTQTKKEDVVNPKKYKALLSPESNPQIRTSYINEPEISYSVSSKIRAVGNSKGIILSNRVIKEAGISVEADIIIQASKGVITIAEVKAPNQVNTDLSTWDAQFKKAIKPKNKPESDLWKGIQNSFDREEWT